jgi:hypothetical protein
VPIAAVEVGQLLEVVWVSLVAGVTVTALFSFVVLGGARSADAQRSGRTGAAWVYGGLAILALLAFGVVVVYGLTVMLSKD